MDLKARKLLWFIYYNWLHGAEIYLFDGLSIYFSNKYINWIWIWQEFIWTSDNNDKKFDYNLIQNNNMMNENRTKAEDFLLFNGWGSFMFDI